jgi:hypothetical protein
MNVNRIGRRRSVLLDKTITPNARLLYFLIDDKAGERGTISWHWSKLAEILGLGKTQYFASIKELELAGFVQRNSDGQQIGTITVRNVERQNDRRFGKPSYAISENRTVRPAHLITELDDIKQSTTNDSIRELARESLCDYPLAPGTKASAVLGPPDDQIVEQCLQAVCGNWDSLKSILLSMSRDRLHPRRSWGWFPVVIRSKYKQSIRTGG